MDRHDVRSVRIGERVWRLEPDGVYRFGEVVSRDDARSAFSVAWLGDAGGVFHVPEKLLGLGVWGLGEPPLGEPPIAESVGPVSRCKFAPFESDPQDDAEAA